MSAEFWSAYADTAATPPGPEHDAAMGRADEALAAAERETARKGRVHAS